MLGGELRKIWRRRRRFTADGPVNLPRRSEQASHDPIHHRKVSGVMEKNVARRLDGRVLETQGGALVWRRTEERPLDGNSGGRGALGDAQKVSVKRLLTL